MSNGLVEFMRFSKHLLFYVILDPLYTIEHNGLVLRVEHQEHFKKLLFHKKCKIRLIQN